MRQFGLTAVVRNAGVDCSQATSTMTTKYQMHLVEKLLFKIAAFCVGRAMRIRQRRQTFPVLQRQNEIIARQEELKNRPVCLVRVIQGFGKSWMEP